MFGRLRPRGTKTDWLAIHFARSQFEDDLAGELLGDHAAGFFFDFANRTSERVFALFQPSLGKVPALVGEIGIADEQAAFSIDDYATPHKPLGRRGGGINHFDGIGHLIDDQLEGHPTFGDSAGIYLLCGKWRWGQTMWATNRPRAVRRSRQVEQFAPTLGVFETFHHLSKSLGIVDSGQLGLDDIVGAAEALAPKHD